MVGFIDWLFGTEASTERAELDSDVHGAKAIAPPVIPLASLGNYGGSAYWDGEKYPGGMGPVYDYTTDYWTLRERSRIAFEQNLYAKGLINRLVSNEINTGLNLECEPSTSHLGMGEDDLMEWSESTEEVFSLWGRGECDWNGNRSWGAIQRIVRRRSLIEGDILVVMRQSSQESKQIQLICGHYVNTPPTTVEGVPERNRVENGVEYNPAGREVAYWVEQDDGSFKRIRAVGRNSGRRQAWLVRSHQMLGHNRGTPLLAVVLQSLKEMDRYRDAALRKAALNAILVGFTTKAEDKIGTKPMTGGAVRRDEVETEDGDGSERTNQFTEHLPGVWIDELQTGEKPEVHSTAGTDVHLGEFEKAILAAIGWANEIPPEILFLSFSSNYSASQAAINEFKLYLNKARAEFSDQFCQPIYQEWLISEALAGRIDRSAEILAAWRSSNPRDFEAWSQADWAGAIKPSADLLKTAKAYGELIDRRLITHERAAREVTGMKWSKIMKKQRREAPIVREVNELLGAKEQQGQGNQQGQAEAMAEIVADAVRDALEDLTIDTTSGES